MGLRDSQLLGLGLLDGLPGEGDGALEGRRVVEQILVEEEKEKINCLGTILH